MKYPFKTIVFFGISGIPDSDSWTLDWFLSGFRRADFFCGVHNNRLRVWRRRTAWVPLRVEVLSGVPFIFCALRDACLSSLKSMQAKYCMGKGTVVLCNFAEHTSETEKVSVYRTLSAYWARYRFFLVMSRNVQYMGQVNVHAKWKSITRDSAITWKCHENKQGFILQYFFSLLVRRHLQERTQYLRRIIITSR